MDYYVNNKQQENGDNEVHRQDCYYLPSPANRRYLGSFSNCKDAVNAAKKIFSQANGCNTCSRECHTT